MHYSELQQLAFCTILLSLHEDLIASVKTRMDFLALAKFNHGNLNFSKLVEI